jgi:MFS family permease
MADLVEVQGDTRRGIGRANAVFWIMFSISFLNYLDRYVLTGAANVMAKELGFDLSGIGYVTTAFLVFYTLCAIPFGIWADRARRKDVVAFSVAVWSIVTVGTALATNFLTLFLSRMLLGVGEAGYFPAGTALLSDYFSRARRSRVMSWWSTGQLIGILGGYGLGGALAGLYAGSWRLAFLFTGIPGLVLAFLVWRVREPRRNQADEEAQENDPLVPALTPEEQEPVHGSIASGGFFAHFGQMLRIKTLAVLIVMQIFAYFVLGVNTAFLPTYLQQKDTFGLSSGLAGLYSGGVIVLAGIAGTVVGGYMADMLNRRHPGSRVLVCGIGFLLGAPSFVLAMLYHDLTIFTIFFVITAFLLTIYTGPSTAATQDVVPSALRASAVAITLLIAHMLGDAFAPALVGVIATSIDPTHGAHFLAGEAGKDLSWALLVTCTPALTIAGLIGIFGARWMAADVAAAEQADAIVSSRSKAGVENI